MKEITYRGSRLSLSINTNENIDAIEKIEQVYSEIIDNFKDFYYSGSGAVITLYDNKTVIDTMILSPNLEHGIYIQYLENSKDARNIKTYLSVYQKSELDTIIESFDEIYVSKGLFLPKEKAWLAIYDFIVMGIRSPQIDWITPNDIPEGGNW